MSKYTVPKRSVLLFSGGMDSVAIAHLWPADVLLYVDARTRYAAKELAHVRSLPWADVVVDQSFDFSSWERDDALVPMRNMLFGAAAARYGNDLLFGFTAGDRPRDKDEQFTIDMTYMLSRLHETQSWCEGVEIRVRAPARHLSKGELLRAYLDAGHPVSRLVDGISCYAAVAGHCGVCKACVRKWAALMEVGVDVRNYDAAFDAAPTTPHFEELRSGARGTEGRMFQFGDS